MGLAAAVETSSSLHRFTSANPQHCSSAGITDLRKGKNPFGIECKLLRRKSQLYDIRAPAEVALFNCGSAHRPGYHSLRLTAAARRANVTAASESLPSHSSLPPPSVSKAEHLLTRTLESNPSKGPGVYFPHSELSRSQLFRGLLLGVGACVTGGGGGRAEAVGLISLPPTRLTNEYFLVRAGESVVEAQGHIMTNPVAKTSMDSGLSRLGQQQVLSSIQRLRDLGACTSNCWIWPSITQRSYQTAELVASAFSVGRSRIVPEYSFLDARGLGSYEGRSLSQIKEIYESDMESPYYRPPRYVDGTPNESVEDVLVRVRQLMSILETQYQGDQVVIVSPDSDNLSVLQAALLGMDLRRHSTLAFRPGEVRKVVLSSEAPPPPTNGFFKCKQLPNRQWNCAVT